MHIVSDISLHFPQLGQLPNPFRRPRVSKINPAIRGVRMIEITPKRTLERFHFDAHKEIKTVPRIQKNMIIPNLTSFVLVSHYPLHLMLKCARCTPTLINFLNPVFRVLELALPAYNCEEDCFYFTRRIVELSHFPQQPNYLRC